LQNNSNNNTPFKSETKIKQKIDDSLITKLEEINDNTLPIISMDSQNINDKKPNNLINNDDLNNHIILEENNMNKLKEENDSYEEFCNYVMRDPIENESLGFAVSNVKYSELIVDSIDNFTNGANMENKSNLYNNNNNLENKLNKIQIENSHEIEIIKKENFESNINNLFHNYNKEYLIENNYFEYNVNYYEILEEKYNANKGNEEYLSKHLPKHFLEYKKYQIMTEKLIVENEENKKDIEKLKFYLEEKNITVGNYTKSYNNLLNELDSQELIRKTLHNYI